MLEAEEERTPYGPLEEEDHIGCVSLWYAVLKRAIIDATIKVTDADDSKSIARRLTKKRARDWIFSENKAKQSFLWVCSVVTAKPESIRNHILDPYFQPEDRTIESIPAMVQFHREFQDPLEEYSLAG
jgi:hypothetical protein